MAAVYFETLLYFGCFTELKPFGKWVPFCFVSGAVHQNGKIILTVKKKQLVKLFIPCFFFFFLWLLKLIE